MKRTKEAPPLVDSAKAGMFSVVQRTSSTGTPAVRPNRVGNGF